MTNRLNKKSTASKPSASVPLGKTPLNADQLAAVCNMQSGVIDLVLSRLLLLQTLDASEMPLAVKDILTEFRPLVQGLRKKHGSNLIQSKAYVDELLASDARAKENKARLAEVATSLGKRMRLGARSADNN